MSDRYTSFSDIYDKVDWEGGLTEAILGYGLTSEYLPEDTPGDIVLAWQQIECLAGKVALVQDWLEEHSDDGREYD